MRIHGRRSLALVVAWDSRVFGNVLVALLLSAFGGYDLFLFALHLPHVFTIMLGYVAVHYSPLAVDTLRMLVFFYLIALVLDSVVLVGRIVFVVSGGETRFAELVRAALALLFIGVDLCGAFFTDLSRHSAETLLLRTDEQVQALAYQQHALAAAARAKPPPEAAAAEHNAKPGRVGGRETV